MKNTPIIRSGILAHLLNQYAVFLDKLLTFCLSVMALVGGEQSLIQILYVALGHTTMQN